MPRHERQQQQQRNTSLFNRLRNNVEKILLKRKRNKNNDNTNNSNQQSTSKKGLDWRTLSPEFPPLPAIDRSPPSTTVNGDIITNFNNNNNNISNSNSSAEHVTSSTEKVCNLFLHCIYINIYIGNFLIIICSLGKYEQKSKKVYSSFWYCFYTLLRKLCCSDQLKYAYLYALFLSTTA